MAVFTLRKVSRLPTNAFFALWRLKDGTEVKHALTEAEYRALALKGAGAPTNRTGDAEAVWVLAREDWVFDTPSGVLEPGDVSDAWVAIDGEVMVRTPKGRLRIPVADVQGATLELLSVEANKMPPGYSLVGGVLTVP